MAVVEILSPAVVADSVTGRIQWSARDPTISSKLSQRQASLVYRGSILTCLYSMLCGIIESLFLK